jgi:hypothetical protein
MAGSGPELAPWKRSQQAPVHEIPAGKFAVYIIWTRAGIRSASTLSLPGSIPTDGMLECYVGYGQGKRPWAHFDNARERARNPHKTRVLDKEKAAGRDPLITIALITDTKQQATDVEVLLEKIIGRVDLGTGCLGPLLTLFRQV